MKVTRLKCMFTPTYCQRCNDNLRRHSFSDIRKTANSGDPSCRVGKVNFFFIKDRFLRINISSLESGLSSPLSHSPSTYEQSNIADAVGSAELDDLGLL